VPASRRNQERGVTARRFSRAIKNGAPTGPRDLPFHEEPVSPRAAENVQAGSAMLQGVTNASKGTPWGKAQEGHGGEIDRQCLRRLAHRFGGDAPKLRHRNRVKLTAEPDAHDRRVAQVRVLIDERNSVPVGISPSNWSKPRSGSPGCGLLFGNRLPWMLHTGDHPDDMDPVGAEHPSWAPEDIGSAPA
jgi:hypothetical protein